MDSEPSLNKMSPYCEDKSLIYLGSSNSLCSSSYFFFFRELAPRREKKNIPRLAGSLASNDGLSFRGNAAICFLRILLSAYLKKKCLARRDIPKKSAVYLYILNQFRQE